MGTTENGSAGSAAGMSGVGLDGGNFVKQISDLTLKRSDPKLITLPETDPRHALWNPATGEYEYFNKTPGWRSHNVSDVISLVRAVEQYGEGATIWIGDNRIVAVLKDTLEGNARSDLVSMPLTQTFQFKTATKIEGVSPAALDIIFSHLQDGVFADNVRKLFRNFRFKSATEIAGDRGVGRESISTAAKSEAAFNGAEPPDELIASVFVFEEFSDICSGAAAMGFEPEVFRQKVRMKVEIDFQNSTISLPPMESEVKRAVLMTKALIRNHLCQQIQGVEVLIGNP